MRVLIVGAGILGLSTAWALVRAGHEPVVVERGRAPDPRASSFDRHRVIRVTYGAEHGYAAMALEAFSAWERLFADLGRNHLVQTGQILLGPPEEPWIRDSLASLARLGLTFEPLDGGALQRRFPHLDLPKGQGAWFIPKAGALLADRICTDLSAWLVQQGITILEGAEVVAVEPEQARLRTADGRTLEADALLVAAGVWTGRLFAEFRERLQPSRQTVVYVRPPAPMAAAWEEGPVILAKDGREGFLFYALPATRGAAPKFGDHNLAVGGDPDGERTPQEEAIASILALARRVLVDAESYAVLEARTCFYTVTADERFFARKLGRTLVVSACSGHGFKFGALLGERTAQALSGTLAFEAYRAWIEGRALA